VPEDVFLEELEFYQLGDNIIQDYKEKEGFIMEKKMLLPKVRSPASRWMFLSGIFAPTAALAKSVKHRSGVCLCVCLQCYILLAMTLGEKSLSIPSIIRSDPLRSRSPPLSSLPLEVGSHCD